MRLIATAHGSAPAPVTLRARANDDAQLERALATAETKTAGARGNEQPA